jgi:hypothetical protein
MVKDPWIRKKFIRIQTLFVAKGEALFQPSTSFSSSDSKSGSYQFNLFLITITTECDAPKMVKKCPLHTHNGQAMFFTHAHTTTPFLTPLFNLKQKKSFLVGEAGLIRKCTTAARNRLDEHSKQISLNK